MGSQTNGRRRPTIVDIAKRVGVSTAAVSMVLRDLPGVGADTRRRILEAAAELDYRPDSRAKLLRSTSTRVLGVLYSLTSPFHADLVQWLYRSAEKHQLIVTLGGISPEIPSPNAIEALLSSRCDGIILVGPELMDERTLSLASQVPSVAIGHMAPRPGVDVVHASGSEGINLAVAHLVELGHKNIAHLAAVQSIAGMERRQAYERSMKNHGLARYTRILDGDGSDFAGATAARELLANGLPSAVIAYNDNCAIGLLFELLRAGVSIPGDISIVGYDDSHVASLPHIGLTSVAQDSPHLAEVAVQRIAQRISSTEAPGAEASTMVLQPHLMPRMSSGPARSPQPIL